MREAKLIVFKDENGCSIVEVKNIDYFNTLTGVARAINEGRNFRKLDVQFIEKPNAFSKKELREAEKILK